MNYWFEYDYYYSNFFYQSSLEIKIVKIFRPNSHIFCQIVALLCEIYFLR